MGKYWDYGHRNDAFEQIFNIVKVEFCFLFGKWVKRKKGGKKAKSSCVTFTFLPSSSCVPWVSTLSTLFGSLNVTKPKPLQVDLEGDVNRRRLARSSANIYPSQEPSNWTWTSPSPRIRKTERDTGATAKVEPAIVSLARAPIRRSNYIKILPGRSGSRGRGCKWAV